jgi:hypothetical protein
MNSKLTLGRLRKWRTDSALRWVKPAYNKYSVIVWRRVNPRYQVDYDGVNENINAFQFVEIHYARYRWLAIIYQAILGRDKWSDGFKQQRVEIIPPNYQRVIFRDVLAPEVSPFDFDGYPSVKGFDDVNDDRE